MNKPHIAIIALLALLPAPTLAQDASRNYVKTVTMLDASDTTLSLKAVQYYDGLGYPTVAVATAGANGETACTLTTYDGVGRERRKYLPVPGTGLDCLAEGGIISKGYDFYHDNSCFTQSHIDALDRVAAVDIAGDDWVQAGKQDRSSYLANTLSDSVLHYEAPEDGSYSLTLPENTSFQYYPAGSLGKVVSFDADDKSVAIFTDLTGRKILERTAAGDTYYVYNDLGQLRFVLSPAFNKQSDKIFLIGSFAEASKYCPGSDNPYQELLLEVKKLLKKDGQVFIAIENKYGMKYFNGAKEDHTGNAFESIEGYQTNDVRTFSSVQLRNMLKDAGYKDVYFYYPLPDYKFPNVIYSEDYLPKLDGVTNVGHSLDRDRAVLFNEDKALGEAADAGLFEIFANSFLIKAGL